MLTLRKAISCSAVAAGAVILTGILAWPGVAAGETTVHQSATTTNSTWIHPLWCTTQWWITADGVRIHTRPSLAATVRGLSYGYHQVAVYVYNNPAGWSEIDDYLGTKIVGWVSDQFLMSDEWCD